MLPLDQYAKKYEFIRFERRDGILQVTFHTNGDSLRWNLKTHSELPSAFADIAQDRENRIVILTGIGNEFSGPPAGSQSQFWETCPTIKHLDKVHWEGRAMLMNLLSIEVPVITALNGPAWRHAEFPLLSDIVLASETTKIQDSGHFINNMAPGDGMHIVFPMLLGMNRGRYFLLTGQILDAQQSLELGLVNEVLPQDKVLARAWEIAADMAKRPTLLLRYSRLLLVEHLRKRMQDLLGYGLGMESLAILGAYEERAGQPAVK
ncbi:MAG TPA: enoyl-CoA hydratase/isomerase family protein [Ramlibacter sp.]|uniref:enoyl-CoA hydratase/isomerase family protein n=1 Tax=Ramlibacter sp. TaxID=1917967 RepID=UPI002CF8EF77|nr:enoyl-CoA hydratase/isomerase family protein [Ramlibacter sp.]HVZ45489.1 enoyl-CoA hydratase/isomerase family protein [Ramlibacter sp.]